MPFCLSRKIKKYFLSVIKSYFLVFVKFSHSHVGARIFILYIGA
jgi:hypothetical protein